jgi:hypothetical protein
VKQLAYHTALKGRETYAAPKRTVETQAGVAFVHDIRVGLPLAYMGCDVLYADLPWRAGFAEFEKRAGEPAGASYAEFLKAVGEIVQADGRLIILVTGPHARSLLPLEDQRLDLLLNGNPAIAAAYHGTIPWVNNTIDLLHCLADTYRCIGDFCCGYGRAGRIFAEHGKRFVMSDYNAQCIGYIGETFQ